MLLQKDANLANSAAHTMQCDMVPIVPFVLADTISMICMYACIGALITSISGATRMTT